MMSDEAKSAPANGRVVFYAWVIAATLVAAGLRTYHLGHASFWIDELLGVKTCAEPGRAPLSKALGYVPTWMALRLNHTPASNIDPDAPETWRAMGITEGPLRSLPCLIGILTIPLLALASRRMLGSGAACVAALLLAVAPWHIEWSQAGRYYTQQFLFYNLALVWYYTATQTQSKGWMAAAMTMLALAFFTQPTALIICAVFGADWVGGFIHREKVRIGPAQWIVIGATVALCAGVVLSDMLRTPSDWGHLAGTQHQTPFKMLFGTVYMAVPVTAVLAAAAGWWHLSIRPRLTVYLAAAAFLPPLILAIMSMRFYVGLRYALLALYAWLALGALALDRLSSILRRPAGLVMAWTPLALVLVPVLFMNFAYFTSGYGFHRRWREAYAYVAAHRAPGDIVATGPFNSDMLAKYYLEDADLVRSFPDSPQALKAMGSRVWLVFEEDSSIEQHTDEAVGGAWVGKTAELKAVYGLRVLQPVATVNVYLYHPSRGHAMSDTS